jgi:glycosyltransferase involved in cell wall biosynthesis
MCLLRQSYDLVHAQWGQSGLLSFPKAIPLVVTFRGDDLEGIVGQGGQYRLSGQILQTGSKIVASFADEIILVSETLAVHLPQKRYTVIPSGLDLDLFRPMDKSEARHALGFPLRAKLVFFGGRPSVARKRYGLALSAFDLLKRQFPRARMIAAEDIEHAQMPLYMNACDVLLLTSLHEGSPNVIKEALACNLPIVSTDVGDVRQRIGDVDGCVVCRDDQIETIAAALEKVFHCDSPIAGREAVLGLDERKITRDVVAVYEKALNARA